MALQSGCQEQMNKAAELVPLQEAANEVVMKKLVEKGGEGGLIAVDKFGNIALPFNAEGMCREFARPGERKVMIYK